TELEICIGRCNESVGAAVPDTWVYPAVRIVASAAVAVFDPIAISPSIATANALEIPDFMILALHL
ncbi:MAG: hypothetical protein HY288_04325, partial [Planctomycetia bacterium]|nr:hypothetical protein [Planctomycetia bacterium]